MYKIAVIGDKHSILAFKALGIDVFAPTDAMDARKTVDRLAKEGYAIIFITEKLASFIPDTIRRYDQLYKPAVILIPNSQGTLNLGMERISEYAEKAVGTKLL
ncbi:V-type ATP synthase subunit F [Fervidibacillus halotolerans]|uniref:V-type ATP synthase subunit F n=1 Tax=Fervidibacillus halotolerans TaxID=2980027 RepID=A0A9E8LY57_9BACI|nr:V-type ATP synthase subunit F [Fervidibacillus halotolerans]WAA11721.1 V-type ATP synthase subunit F [Fervidibacillus halotolerans]